MTLYSLFLADHWFISKPTFPVDCCLLTYYYMRMQLYSSHFAVDWLAAQTRTRQSRAWFLVRIELCNVELLTSHVQAELSRSQEAKTISAYSLQIVASATSDSKLQSQGFPLTCPQKESPHQQCLEHTQKKKQSSFSTSFCTQQDLTIQGPNIGSSKHHLECTSREIH